MSSIHTPAAGARSRTVPSDLDLDLQRAGNRWDLTPDDRMAILRTAELLGCWTAIDRILDTQRRRTRVKAAPDPAPRPGPKPKPTPARQPVMNLVQGGGEESAISSSRQVFSLRMARLAEEAVRAPWATLSEKSAWAETARDLREASLLDDERPELPPAS